MNAKQAELEREQLQPRPTKQLQGFTEEERTILRLGLHYMIEEINRFKDKKAEYGDLNVTINQIEDLKEYLLYG